MVTRKHKPEQPPSEAERAFWCKAFVGAEWPILLAHDGQQLTPEGAMHLCADCADAAVAEYKRRFK